ncbi:MAG: LarC family nickel insertion protein [Candidatus Tectomicrobia bacterium]|uniref:LarC family nickel insertion protein n=1 Tax=Tectimicrobiota bacterium TaxID=2528274 RepID=A0A937W0G2_UNCTE|nr:LarC family nickel insertion protein [Candidatus Tectomicrobia bacterium]
MRTAYVHGYEGVTGPLLLGALLDAGASLTRVQQTWQELSLPAIEIECTRVTAGATAATQVDWTASHASAGLPSQGWTALEQSLTPASVTPRVRAMLQRLRTAITRVHGVAEETACAQYAEIALEVLYLGSAVVGALEELGIEQVIAAPLPLGTGVLDSTQGRLPLPHPLTAELSRGVPICSRGIPADAECTTVVGAAILTTCATQFGPLPDMTMIGTGYGQVLGAAPEATARRLQALLGETAGPAAAERIAVLEANIDDMNPEFYEFVAERLFAHGALDVTLTPLYMKKQRPANTLTVLAPLPAAPQLARLMLQETSTFGVRVHEVWRHKLDRFHRQVDTRYGVVPVKCGVLDGRMVQAAPEYEVCKRLAKEQGVSIRLVYAEAASLAASWLT